MQGGYDLLAHQPNGAHQLFVLDAAEHHPVADVRCARAGCAPELLDDGLGAAKVESIEEGIVVQFTVERACVNIAPLVYVVAAQAALGASLPAHIGQRFERFFIGGRDMRHALQCQ